MAVNTTGGLIRQVVALLKPPARVEYLTAGRKDKCITIKRPPPPPPATS